MISQKCGIYIVFISGSARDFLFLLPPGQTTGVVFDTKQTVVVDRVVVVDVVEI